MIGSFLFTRKNIMLTKKHAMNLLMKTNLYQSVNLFNENKEQYNTFEILSQIIPNISLSFKTDLFKAGMIKRLIIF